MPNLSRIAVYLCLLSLPTWIAGCGNGDDPTPGATATATRVATATATPAATASNTAAPTVSPIPTASATNTALLTATLTATPANTSTAIASPTHTPSPSASTTASATSSPTATASATATPSDTSEPTLTPTVTPTGVALPNLALSAPADGATAVSRTAWVRLDFAADVVDGSLSGFTLTCDGTPHPVSSSRISASALVVNPVGELTGGSHCVLSWPSAGGGESINFTTAPAGNVETAIYDRSNARLTVPFPDDVWLKADANTASGWRLNVPVPTAPGNVQAIFRTLVSEPNKLDGFSPIAHLVVELSAAPDPTSFPRTAAESLDPLASIVLFNVTPGDAYGERIPFEIRPRSDASLIGVVSHTLLIFPSIPFEQHNQYGLVVTNRVFADPSRPFEASTFFQAVKGAEVPGEAAMVSKVRGLVGDVLAAAAAASPAIPRDDVALATRFTIRTTDTIPNTLRSVKDQVLAMPAPVIAITAVHPDSVADSDVVAIVEGTWEAPDWRENGYFKRDANGDPVHTKTNTVPFILALPKAALNGPVPITMYQHGNPGSAQAEVPGSARRSLAAAGFAVVGFTDILNRELSGGLTGDAAIANQITAIFFGLLQKRRVPDAWLQTNADQIAFLRIIEGLGALDVLPIGNPDGVPDLNVEAPLTYLGISQGANHAPGLLPFAPEIKAAALVAGGARMAEVLVHQQPELFITQLGMFYSDLTPGDIWVGVALFQALVDDQDVHNQARFIYRDPFPVRGTTDRASILLLEGINDSLVPNNTTNSLAYALFPLPQLQPAQRVVPYLEQVEGPITANINDHTSAAFFQYTPVGVAGIPPSPGCVVLPERSANEGHFCAQSAAESLQQRVVFFQSALSSDPAPTIINPYAGGLQRARRDFTQTDRDYPDRDRGEEAY